MVKNSLPPKLHTYIFHYRLCEKKFLAPLTGYESARIPGIASYILLTQLKHWLINLGPSNALLPPRQKGGRGDLCSGICAYKKIEKIPLTQCRTLEGIWQVTCSHNICLEWWDGIVGYSTSHEDYCLWVGNHFLVIIYTQEDEVIWRWRASPTVIQTQYRADKGATMLHVNVNVDGL